LLVSFFINNTKKLTPHKTKAVAKLTSQAALEKINAQDERAVKKRAIKNTIFSSLFFGFFLISDQMFWTKKALPKMINKPAIAAGKRTAKTFKEISLIIGTTK